MSDRLDLGSGCWVQHTPGWIEPNESRKLMGQLIDELPLQSYRVTVFGKRHPQPRLTAWHADPGCEFTYSNLTLPPAPWHEALLAMRGRLLELTGADFNSVLANLYRDGKDSMGWHADDEDVFGEDPVIASVSLGSPRSFKLRHLNSRKTQAWALGQGDLFLMGGRTQHFFHHGIAKTAKAVGPRLNLTWRRYLV